MSPIESLLPVEKVITDHTDGSGDFFNNNQLCLHDWLNLYCDLCDLEWNIVEKRSEEAQAYFN